jgi:general secretion pathway protein G
MRYSLHSLMICTALLPPFLAGTASVFVYRTRCSCLKHIATGQISTLCSAVNMYRIHVGELPRDLEDLILLPSDLSDPTKWAGPYLEDDRLPDDPWNNPYHYEVLDPFTDRYRIWSKGTDMLPRTKDDIPAQ